MLVDEAISAQDLLLPQGAAESHCDRQHTTRRDEELQWGGVLKCADVDKFLGQSEFTHTGDGNINKGDAVAKKLEENVPVRGKGRISGFIGE